jgi:hypothetical protein
MKSSFLILLLLGAAFLLGIGALLVSSHRHFLAQQPTRTTLPDGSILIQSTSDAYLGVSDVFDFIPVDSPQTVERVGTVESHNGVSLQYADLGRPVLFGQIGGPLVYVFVRSAAGEWRQTELRAQNPTVSTADRSLRVWTWLNTELTEWYRVASETGAFERVRSAKGWQQ